MAFEVPHKNDLSLDGQTIRNQLIENFKAIEQAISNQQTEIDKMKQEDQQNKSLTNDVLFGKEG